MILGTSLENLSYSAVKFSIHPSPSSCAHFAVVSCERTGCMWNVTHQSTRDINPNIVAITLDLLYCPRISAQAFLYPPTIADRGSETSMVPLSALSRSLSARLARWPSLLILVTSPSKFTYTPVALHPHWLESRLSRLSISDYP